jgi:hypothetical protein
MIQKRYKQTEALLQAEGLKNLIESQEVVLAELPLPEITDMPNYNQVLRIKDVNVATSVDFVKLTPKRILIHKITGKELKLDLFVPDWTITKNNVSSYINENGERVMFEMEYYDDELEEVVTPEDLPELEPEVFLLPTIPYLMFFTKAVVLPDLIQLFSAQFIQDNIEIWSELENGTFIAKP